MEAQGRQAAGARHPRADRVQGRGGVRQQAAHRRPGAAGQGGSERPHRTDRLGPAVAGAVDDRGQEAALHVQPVAGHPRPFLGAAAGHPERALHLQRARGLAPGRDGADERRQRSEGRA
ncbi:hypothetical protein G6F35_016131 [Rhizopus arrhizus]|nr:hypothetical protein G6F35_016131 [Rhizopus arrhizus]